MTAYFDALEREIRELSDEAKTINGGDNDFFIDQLGRVEEGAAKDALLNSGDREFPEDLREKITGAIALHGTRDLNGCGLGREFYAKPRRLALAMRRSQLVGELHSIFHELVQRRIETRFGRWTDDPAANLKTREAHDKAKASGGSP